MAIRKVMDTGPSRRTGLPYLEEYANVERYRELHILKRHYAFTLLRHDCQRSLNGRLCSRRDYPYQQYLWFKPCDERPLRDARVSHVPPVMRNRDDLAHYYSHKAAMKLVADGVIDAHASPAPTSQQLKAWVKERKGLLTPSGDEVSRLVCKLLSCDDAPSSVSDAITADVERWFEDKRMQRYLKAEEQQAALLDQSSKAHALKVATKLLHAAAAKISGIASPLARRECCLLLEDERIGLSPHGPFKVLMERIFENREHIMSMLGIDQAFVETTPSAEEMSKEADDDPLLCAVCMGDASEARPILKCDGVHATEVGYHLDCLPNGHTLDELPSDDQDWLCPECRESNLYVVHSIRGKKQSYNGVQRVHYLCHWEGYDTDVDTYEPLENIPKQARAMIKEYNNTLRAAAPAPSKRAKK